MDEWDKVTVLKKRTAGPKTAHTQAEINEARRTGAVLAVEKKQHVAGNKGKATDLNAAKLDRETEELSHKYVSPDVGRAMQAGRQAKGFTQKDLATRCNEKPQVVSEYEQGKAIPNQQILGKFERALGVKLRGKDIGAPLGGPKKK